MDSAYLKEHVGKALALGLAEICQKKPADPIDYLSKWLRKHVENLKNAEKAAGEAEEVAKQRQQAEEEKSRQEALLEEQNHIANEILKRDMERQAVEEAAQQQQVADEEKTDDDSGAKQPQPQNDTEKSVDPETTELDTNAEDAGTSQDDAIKEEEEEGDQRKEDSTLIKNEGKTSDETPVVAEPSEEVSNSDNEDAPEGAETTTNGQEPDSATGGVEQDADVKVSESLDKSTQEAIQQGTENTGDNVNNATTEDVHVNEEQLTDSLNVDE